MKKIILIIAIHSLAIVAVAQTKKKQIETQIDTISYVQTYKDLGNRIEAFANLIFALVKPGDITPNNRDKALQKADSLLKVDIAKYNKNELLKKNKTTN